MTWVTSAATSLLAVEAAVPTAVLSVWKVCTRVPAALTAACCVVPSPGVAESAVSALWNPVIAEDSTFDVVSLDESEDVASAWVSVAE